MAIKVTGNTVITNSRELTNIVSYNGYDPLEQTANTGSAVIPSGTTAQRDGSPVNGYLRYNSTDGAFEGYAGGEWAGLGGGGGDAVAALTPAANVDLDVSSTNYFTLTPDQNTTLTVSGASAVDRLTLTLTGADVPLGTSIDYATPTTTYTTVSPTANPRSVRFKPDGTKMYIFGTQDVTQHTLSTAWDLSTASYDSVFHNFASQGTNGYSVFFKPDGTKMYYLEITNDRIYQYSLSTAWDLSTVSYDNLKFLVSGQEANAFDIFFKPDGTKLYVAGNGGDVYQYTLSTAWAINTASYDSVSFDPIGQYSNATFLLAFNSAGTTMYLGTSNDTQGGLFGYSLSTAWDVSTATADGSNFAIYPVSNGMYIDESLSLMYLANFNDNKITEYDLDGVGKAEITYPASFQWNKYVPNSPSAGNVLTINAYTTDFGTTWYAEPEIQDSGKVLLNETVISTGVAAVDLTMPSGYTSYELIISNLTIDSSTATLGLQFGRILGTVDETMGDYTTSTATGSIGLGSTVGSAAGSGLSARVLFTKGSGIVRAIGKVNSANSAESAFDVFGRYNFPEPYFVRVYVFTASRTMTAGTFSLYGNIGA